MRKSNERITETCKISSIHTDVYSDCGPQRRDAIWVDTNVSEEYGGSIFRIKGRAVRMLTSYMDRKQGR
jgi:hypothetical protein